MVSTLPLIGFINEEPDWQRQFKRIVKGNFSVYTKYSLDRHTSLDNLVQEVINSQIQLLVIDYNLKEANNVSFLGHDIAIKINELHEKLPIYILTAYPEDARSSVPEELPILAKEDMTNNQSAIIEKMKGSVVGYQREFEEARIEIEALVDKELKVGLSPSEEKRYIELDDFLNRFIAPEMRIPSQYKSKKSIVEFRKLADEAEYILKELEKRDAEVSSENSKEKEGK